MENQSHFLPSLTFNRSFLEAFTSQAPPCFALGMLEVEAQHCGLFALSLGQPLPRTISAPGFKFGTQLLGTSPYEVSILTSTTTDEQYLQVVTSFIKNPQPPGKLLRLVCHENMDFLDLVFHAIALI